MIQKDRGCACKRYLGPVRTVVEVRRRCTAYPKLSRTLYTIAADRDKGLSVARCVKCRTVWAEEQVFEAEDDMHCLYAVRTGDPRVWLQSAEPVARHVVRDDEDRRFYDDLGPELGPRGCLYDGCQRLRILGRNFCRRHHFQMVHDRPCPW